MTLVIKILSVISVLIGAVFIAISIAISRKLHTSVQGPFRSKWIVLSGLMSFFLVGYVAYVALQLTELHFPLELLIGIVFLGGAIFVFIVINLSKATITQLCDFNKTLESRVQERTAELLQSNTALKKSKDIIFAKKSKLEEANLEIRTLIKKSHSDLTVRFENKNLLKCWEENSCEKSDCPAHRSDDLRCWQVQGTKCAEIAEGDFIKAANKCEQCTVYQHIISDPISSIGEQFNILMDKLDYQVYQLEEERKRAEQASVDKSQFLANMSHEIRTPMNAIIGFTDLLLSMDTPAKQKTYLAMIKTSGHRLLDIINDILDFSKIEAGKLELREEPFDLAILLEESMAMLIDKAKEKNLHLTYTIPQMAHKLIGDSGKIRQVLVNLVGNAIKFTDIGSIVVSVTANPTENSDNERQDLLVIRFSIKDTGVGIPLSQQKNIFRSFTQADGTSTRKFGGTGLGLSISSQLASLMNGKIWVESAPSKGSTFHFSIQLRKFIDIEQKDKLLTSEGVSNLPDAPHEKVAEKKRLRVLLVDDEPINRTLAVAVLEDNGFHVQEADNGERAVSMLAEDNFDIILMDLQMPVMDGLETTRILREKEKGTGSHIPIIALTAHAVKGDKERCLEAGMDGYLTKPFIAADLCKIMATLVH